jgi:small subunit ribosomal protein S17
MESEELIEKYNLFKNKNSSLRQKIAADSENRGGIFVVQAMKKDVESILKKAGVLTRNKSIGPSKYGYIIEAIGQWRALYSYYNLVLESPRSQKYKYYSLTQQAKRSGVRLKKGTVVSDKMDKTIAVTVNKLQVHQPTGKRIKRTEKYLVHDEYEVSKLKDIVLFSECRPISRRKSHKLFGSFEI